MEPGEEENRRKDSARKPGTARGNPGQRAKTRDSARKPGTARENPGQRAIKSSFIHTVSSIYQCIYSFIFAIVFKNNKAHILLIILHA